jgi:hypothetical protein
MQHVGGRLAGGRNDATPGSDSLNVAETMTKAYTSIRRRTLALTERLASQLRR